MRNAKIEIGCRAYALRRKHNRDPLLFGCIVAPVTLRTKYAILRDPTRSSAASAALVNISPGLQAHRLLTALPMVEGSLPSFFLSSRVAR
jgi:hypothetical protein